VRPIGFSTGAVAYSDFQRALELMAVEPVNCIELSALRFHEVAPLLNAIETLDLHRYGYVSFHAPSSFTVEQEPFLVEQLKRVPQHWPIVLHPDTIHNWEAWRQFGSQLAVENMDRRKPWGRTVEELARTFSDLPDAAMCFDIGHARQCDTSMTEAYRILKAFQHRLKQIHVSEVNTASQHDPISYAAKIAFQEVACLIPSNIPVIIESRVTPQEINREICRISQALPEFDFVPAITNAREAMHNSPSTRHQN
jgi:hypothetical protein